nr:right-handed parallel beta-helix repeat-containing protein [uncultured Chryseobacterium sp.]
MNKHTVLILLLLSGFLFGKAPFLQVQEYKSLVDTIRVELKGTNTASADTRNLQNAMGTKVSTGVLKIILKGDFQINTVIATNRDHTILSFDKNSKLSFVNETSGLLINKNSCVIENGFFSGTGRSAKSYYEGYGILLQGVSQCMIRNNHFDNISGTNIMMIPNNNTGCQKNTVKNNVFTNPRIETSKNEGDDAVILLGYSGDGYFHSNNVIENNVIDGNNIPKIGIGIIGHGRDNIISNNKIKGLRHYGIIAYESVYTDKSLSGTVIMNNTVENIGNWPGAKTYKGMGIYLMKSPKSKIIGNKIYNVLKSSDEKETLGPGAISVSLSPETVVSDNIVDNSYMYGIVSDYSFNSKFTNNTVKNIRKSGAYFINMNDIEVLGNTFQNIGEVVIKGYFQNTSLQYIKVQMQTDKYLNLDTGNNFVIKNNKFYTKGNILSFTGTEADRSKRYTGNKISSNVFEDNEIIGNAKKSEELVSFKEEKTGSNLIRKNKILK